MKLPRDLDGRTLAQALCRQFGYRIVHQVGSHRVAIPDHRLGTLNAILRAVERAANIQRSEILAALD
jgi:hypothetical protein